MDTLCVLTSTQPLLCVLCDVACSYMLIILMNALDFGSSQTFHLKPLTHTQTHTPMPGNVPQEGPTCLPHEALASLVFPGPSKGFASCQAETVVNVSFCFQLACLWRLQRN